MSEIADSSETSQSTHPELKHHVLTIVAEVLQIEIDPQRCNHLRNETEDWDSVNHLRLAMELEDAFQITLSDEEWATLNSVDEIITLLSARGLKRIQSDG